MSSVEKKNGIAKTNRKIFRRENLKTLNLYILSFMVKVFVVLFATASLQAASDKDKNIKFPRDKDGNIIIYEAGTDNPFKFRLDTGSWIKGGDCIPSTKLVDCSDGKWEEFNYTGTKGIGRALLNCKKVLIKMRAPNEQYIGLKLFIDSAKSGFLTVHHFLTQMDFLTGESVAETMVFEQY